MTRRCLFTAAAAAIAATLAGGPVRAEIHLDHHEAIDRFQVSLIQYMAIREMALRHLPAPHIPDNRRSLPHAMQARAAAIVSVRGNGARGDIFNAAVSDLFRARIRHTLAEHGYRVDQAISDGEDENGAPTPATVNGRFFWNTAVATPPCVLQVLPVLPPELEYRFVGPDLALVDIGANLIVDVLADAIATS